MSIITGKDGVLRILDSADILCGTAPRDDHTVDMVKWDGAAAYTNITSECEADDTSYANDFLTDNDDAAFVGSTKRFARIKYLKGGAADYAVASGILKIFYFDGTDFASSITLFVDGTASGGNCFAQDGIINFKIPSDWAIGAATAVSANLDDDKYYIKLMTTDSPSTDPDADVLCPVDGQFFEIAFSDMDFTGPFGRARPEEILKLNRGMMDGKGHYVNQSDEALYAVIPITFACKLDDVYNKDDLKVALNCGDPDSANWTATGTSTKGDTQNDGSVDNPGLADATKKTVNVQILWDNESGIPIGDAYYEVFFPPDEQSITEAEDGITLSCAGGVYGIIEDVHGLANRY